MPASESPGDGPKANRQASERLPKKHAEAELHPSTD
jgi:hypothetical protein